MKALEKIYQQFLECRSVSTDTRKIEKETIFFALKGGNFDGNDFALQALEQGASMAVVDRVGITGDKVLFVDNVLHALQELARMYRRSLAIPVVGLTGTNGKTTTKELITAVLSQKYRVSSTKGNLNNHIGVPLTVLAIPSDSEIAVVEMGANHPLDIDELTSIAMPTLGLITNVGKAHLEGFGSFEGVKKTKGELYDYLKSEGGKVFLNTDNEHLMGMAKERRIATFVPYGKSEMKVAILPTDLDHPFLRMELNVDSVKRLELDSQIVGGYNADNVLAAVALGIFFDVDPMKIREAIRNYTPDNNRSQLMRTDNNLVIVDCYNANPTSMDAALVNFSKFNVARKVAILGDMLELGTASVEEHRKIITLVEDLKIGTVFFVGAEFKALEDADHLFFSNTNELIDYIKNNPISDSLVLVKGSRGIKLESLLSLL